MMRAATLVAAALACMLAVAACAAVAAASAQDTVQRPDIAAPSDVCEQGSFGWLWNGFHFAWLRRVLGAQTPHRMGTQRHFVDPTSCELASDHWVTSGDFDVTYTPGVDGDFMHPLLYSAAALAPAQEASFTHGSVAFSWQDNSTLGQYPHADSAKSAEFTVMLPAAMKGAQLILQGYEVAMHCVGSPSQCNSNGIWAYHWHINVENGEVGADGSVACTARMEIGRGWTPSHGGGKAYNPVMNYTATVHYTLVGHTSTTTATRDTVTAASNLFNPLTTGTRTPSTAATAAHTNLRSPDAGTPTQAVGITGFEFTLAETDGKGDKGRYIEELAFFVDMDATPAAGKAGTYSYTMGVKSPKLTTYASDLTLAMNTTVFAFPPTMLVQGTRNATSTICEDDPPLFSCKAKGLPASLSDTVNVNMGGDRPAQG